MISKEKYVEVEKDIRALVAEILEEDSASIKNEAHFVKDLGMDSMMALEILASIEKKYRIVIPEESLAKFINLDETVKVVTDILNRK
ncbi:MAG: acyl carrier protein [Candidatus Omnitrophica bacterium]|nr:acyl carrier protein [Candidatus Omnitrophota bacterium]